MKKMNLFEEKNAMTFDEFCKVIVEREKNFEKQPSYGFLEIFNENPLNESETKQLKKSTQFKPIRVSDKPRFIILTHSSETLNQLLCYNLKGVFCDTGDIVVADFSFSGLLTREFGFTDIGKFIEYLKKDNTFLLFTHFEEIYEETTYENTEGFLHDLCNCVEGATLPSIIFSFVEENKEAFDFLTNYFKNYGIDYSHYDVQLQD